MPIAVDWAISMLFYSAVHYVGAYFAKHGLTYRMHQTRDNAVARDPNLSNVYGEYRELEHLYLFTRMRPRQTLGFERAERVKVR